MNSKKAVDHIIEKMRTGLDPSLIYHSLEHTLGVMDDAMVIAKAEKIAPHEKELLLTAAAYHDCGLLKSYNDHEQISADLARSELPRFEFSEDEINDIVAMILATRVPQKPQSHEAEILCDADLSYLGGEDYELIADRLFRELKLKKKDLSYEQWLNIQINFLQEHRYWTDFAKKHYTRGKLKVLERLQQEQEAMSQP